MVVWKKSKSLVSDNICFYPKQIDIPLMVIFNDFDWWKSYSITYKEWLIENRDILPNIIKENVPTSNRCSCIYEYDKRYHGHKHW